METQVTQDQGLEYIQRNYTKFSPEFLAELQAQKQTRIDDFLFSQFGQRRRSAKLSHANSLSIAEIVESHGL